MLLKARAAHTTFFFHEVGCKKWIISGQTRINTDTDLLLTAAAVTAMTVACTGAGNGLYRQSVLSIEQLAVTNHYYLLGNR